MVHIRFPSGDQWRVHDKTWIVLSKKNSSSVDAARDKSIKMNGTIIVNIIRK